ncbi:MAG: aldo/keto reductase [Candidatus Cyclobacteriaceae bacterium M3_2C_046]
MSKEFSRREFIQTLMSGIAMSPAIMSMQKPGVAGIPTRPLGNTGERVSIIGLGGWDVVANKSDQEGVKLMHEALDNGITFWDNCWEYHDGRAESVMGQALAQSSHRNKVFLMTKTCSRSYDGAKKQLEDSLSRLNTDHIDLWQFHSLQYEGDVERIMDPDQGALKAAIEAKKAGKIRFIGFTGHMYPAVHQKMLDQDFNWDSVMMPLNILDAHYKSFQKTVLPRVNQNNMGAIGMKSLAAQNGIIPRQLNISAKLCRSYPLSLPISTLVCGVQTREELLSDIEVGRNFKPLTEESVNELLEKSNLPAQSGEIELYKNPQGYFGCSYHSRVLAREKDKN